MHAHTQYYECHDLAVYMFMLLYAIGFADSFSVNPMSITLVRSRTRFAFECQIDTFAETESDFHQMRIKWYGRFSNATEFEISEIPGSQEILNPLPGYSILVVDTFNIAIDMFPNQYWCGAVFILQNGSEVTVATSEPGLLIIDSEGM